MTGHTILDFEKQIQKVYDRWCICRARGFRDSKMRQQYEGMVQQWRHWMERSDLIKQGDFVRTGTDLKLWLVDVVDTELGYAWISDKAGHVEWVPLSQLEKVGRT